MCLQRFAVLMSELSVLFEHLKEASLLVNGSRFVKKSERVPAVNRHEEVGKQEVHRFGKRYERRLRLDEFKITEQGTDFVHEFAVRFLDSFKSDFGKRLDGICMLFDGLFEVGGFAQLCSSRIHFERFEHFIDSFEEFIGAEVLAGELQDGIVEC